MASNLKKRTGAVLISLLKIIIITLIPSLANQVKQKSVADAIVEFNLYGHKGERTLLA